MKGMGSGKRLGMVRGVNGPKQKGIYLYTQIKYKMCELINNDPLIFNHKYLNIRLLNNISENMHDF